MAFLPGRIDGRRPILDIHSQQSDRVPIVDTEMDSIAVVPLVMVATWSAARHASKVGLQHSGLANISTFLSLPLMYCLLSPNQVDHTNVKSIKKENIVTFIPCERHFFLICIRSILWWILPTVPSFCHVVGTFLVQVVTLNVEK